MAIAKPSGPFADIKSLLKRVSALETHTFGRSGQVWGGQTMSDDDEIDMGTETGNLALNEWVTDQGPTASGLVVAAGRLEIVVSASMTAEGTTPVDLYVSCSISGPTDVSPSFGRGLHIRFDATSGQSATQQASYMTSVTGIDPGEYDVSMAYYTGSIGTPAGSGSVSYRVLKVQPY